MHMKRYANIMAMSSDPDLDAAISKNEKNNKASGGIGIEARSDRPVSMYCIVLYYINHNKGVAPHGYCTTPTPQTDLAIVYLYLLSFERAGERCVLLCA